MVEKTIESTKKIFKYRGKTLEELKPMDVREFSKLLKSRARRMVLRQFNEINEFVNRSKVKIERKKTIKTHDRNLVVVPEMVGMRIHVYNGHAFVPVDIIGEMLGHRFGEFSLTRGKVKHGTAGIGSTKGSKSQAKK
jgi:small subunit ribosomal protein S19